MHDPKRLLDFPGLLNARDLGGYPTRGGERTRWRSLLRSDDLVQLTSAGLRALSEYGLRTVVDLRWPGEAGGAEHPVARDLAHVRYHPISLLAADEMQWSALSAGCTKEMWKCAVLDHSRPQLRHVLQVIASADPGPLLFHCVAGKDRTGLIAALLLALADVEPEAIAYDYAASALQLQDEYVRRYPQIDPEVIVEMLRCPEEGVYNMLAYLERYRGASGYLEEIGLLGDDIARVRARLVA